MTKPADIKKTSTGRLDSANCTAPAYPTPTTEVMATALVDVLHAAELAALLRDGDDLTMAEIKALAAGATALADAAAQHLTKHLDTIIISSAKGVAA